MENYSEEQGQKLNDFITLAHAEVVSDSHPAAFEKAYWKLLGEDQGEGLLRLYSFAKELGADYDFSKKYGLNPNQIEELARERGLNNFSTSELVASISSPEHIRVIIKNIYPELMDRLN